MKAIVKHVLKCSNNWQICMSTKCKTAVSPTQSAKTSNAVLMDINFFKSASQAQLFGGALFCEYPELGINIELKWDLLLNIQLYFGLTHSNSLG